MAIFDEKIEIREWCKGVHCVDLGESFPTSINLQKSASIQPRTSPSKFEGKFNSLFTSLLSGYWRGSSCSSLDFYDSSSRSSSGSCRWTRGSLRLQLNESSWGKARKATAEQPETNMPPSGVSPSLPLQHGTKMQTALNSAACLGLILCIGA